MTARSEKARRRPHDERVQAGYGAAHDNETQQRTDRPRYGRLGLGRFDGAAAGAVRIRHGAIVPGLPRRPVGRGEENI